MRFSLKTGAVVASAALVAVTAGLSTAADRKTAVAPAFTAKQLTAPPQQSWTTNGGNLYNQRYSPLTAIDRANVAQLKGVWRTRCAARAPAASTRAQAQPLRLRRRRLRQHRRQRRVRARSTPARSSGSTTANLDPNITSVCCGWNNRGVALSDDKVFIGQLDGKLVALDRATGKVAWSIQAERWQEDFSITRRAALLRRHGDHRLRRRRSRHARPRQGVRREGRPAASGPSTRSRLPASPATTRGRRTTTRGSTAAPRSGRRRPSISSSVSSISRPAMPAPTTTAASAPATTCTAASMVAIEVATGKYRWHFQQVHHDIWDYDAPNPVVLMDVHVRRAARARRSPKSARPAGRTSSIARPASR